MSLASPLLALIYRARSRGVHLRLQVSFPNPSLLRTAGLRTFLVSRGLLRRCQLAGRGCIFMGLLPSWTPGRLIRRSRGVTPSSVAPSAWGTRRVAQGLEYIYSSFIDMHGSSVGRWQSGGHDKNLF